MRLDLTYRKSVIMIVTLSLIVSTFYCRAQPTPSFRNDQVAIKERIDNLLSLLTLEEKISLLGYETRGVPRLGIPAYNWWNEALHGVARASEATIFRKPLGWQQRSMIV